MARLTPLACGFAVVAGLVGPAQAQQAQPSAAVTVVTVQPAGVTLSTILPGRVRASAEAEVRPQVNGIIVERLFDEGTEVREGDTLYRIDPTTYEAAVTQARALLRQSEAQLAAAQREFDRVSTLSDRGVTSQQTLDDALSGRDSAQAAVEVAQAQLKTSEIELERTDIRARLTGRIGLSDASPGALVTASQAQALTTIRRLDPIYVDVTQSAAEVLAWRRGKATRELRDVNLEVSLTLADGSGFDHKGLLTAAEPHVDEQTGVVVLRMEFANPEQLLLPGMYVQVEMPTTTLEGVFLVPQEGVRRDRRGNPVALVVTAANTVEERLLTIVKDHGADWVVSEGLAAGDRVVVEGVQKVQPGATVTPEERAAPGGGQAGGQGG